LRTIVVGLGVQGKKRLIHAGDDLVATVDPHLRNASFKSIEQVPPDSYDCALVATPDEAKYKIIEYLIGQRKHFLVEKPLYLDSPSLYSEMEQKARAHGVFAYTAYNHRFEPNFAKMRQSLRSNLVGKIYSCRIFYGNGTAKLVRESPWRDCSTGVLQDLGSHLLDTLDFWFGRGYISQGVTTLATHENAAPDHAVTSFKMNEILINLEMSLCSWKNTFECDVVGSAGSLHIRGLCKWGISEFIYRTRRVPAGVPEEKIHSEAQGDPTWQLEYFFFTNQIKTGATTDLSKDAWISSNLDYLYRAGQKL